MKSPLRLLPVVLATLSTACLLEPWSWRDVRDAQVIGDASPADVAMPDGAAPGDVAAPDDALSGDVAVPDVAMPDVAMPDVVMPDVAPLPDDVPCPSGTARCGGACVPGLSSSTNCGACGRVCAAGQSCVVGRCVAGAVPTLL